MDVLELSDNWMPDSDNAVTLLAVPVTSPLQLPVKDVYGSSVIGFLEMSDSDDDILVMLLRQHDVAALMRWCANMLVYIEDHESD